MAKKMTKQEMEQYLNKVKAPQVKFWTYLFVTVITLVSLSVCIGLVAFIKLCWMFLVG